MLFPKPRATPDVALHADTWGVTLPEGYFDNAVGPEPFRETISRFGGPGAQEEWDRLTEHLLELSECTMGLPPFSLRTGRLFCRRGVDGAVGRGGLPRRQFAFQPRVEAGAC